MRYRKRKSRSCPALTIMEIIIALAIITIIFAAVLPQFRVIYNSWDSRQANTEVLQNGRVLIDHINRNLSKAVRITAVSESTETNGFIEFQDNDSNSFRYDINTTSNYVEFGLVGDLSDLAGPVSSLTFTCYDACDLDTPLDIATADVNDIRFVNVQTTLPNPAALGQDKTFTASAYLRTNGEISECGLVGCWKLDEASGLTAADSSGQGNDGTLTNMAGNEWTAGQINGALAFDGTNDYVNLGNDGSLQLTGDMTITVWAKLATGNAGNYYGIAGKLRDAPYAGFALTRHSTNYFYFWIADGTTIESIASNATYTDTNWHHIAGVRRSGTNYLYIDGVEQTATNTRAIRDSGDFAFIGRQYSSYNGRYFKGIIDDVRIYNRALSTEEIAQLAETLEYNGFTEAKVSSDNTSITISTPGTNEGDLLIAAVATDGDTSLSLSPPGGEGWTEVDLDDYSGEVTLGAWWKNADASESSSHQFTWTGGEQAYGWMMRFTGHDPTDPINDYATYGESSSTPTSPDVNTTVDNCLILRLGAFDDSGITVDSPGLPGHSPITMDSSSGAVAILGSWLTGLTHAKESGTNCALVFIAHVEEAGSITLNSVTYGGQTMTKVIDRIVGTNPTAYVVAYILNEAGVAAATSGTFVPNWSTTPDYVAYAHVFLQNVNQTTLIGASASNGVTSGNTITTSALATSNGDMVIDAATCGNTGSYTINNGFTEGTDQTMGGTATGATGYKSATGVAETPSVTHSGANRQVLIGFVVKGGGLTGTVSGGAGYVKQSASGSSGTSNFSLTASEEARTLTIAIAPAADSSGCDGTIRP